MSVDMEWQKGRATMGTIINAARFYRNFRIYHKIHVEDIRFTHEVMFVICDPQCHPPKTMEQCDKWWEITN